MDNNRQWTRKQFLAALGGSSAALFLNPLWSWADQLNINTSQIDRIVANTIGIDTHNHIDVPLDTAELPGPKIDLSEELTKSGLAAIVMTFATDYKRDVQTGEAYQRFLNGLSAMDTALKNNKMSRALNLDDLINAHKKHKPTVIQSVEGCHFLEGQIDRVELAYSRGLRHLGLLHDSDAVPPLGDVYTNTAYFNGLTDLGKQVVIECNRQGILIDMAHASNETINSALEISTKPILISHTGLDSQLGNNPQFAKMMLPRLISKEQAKIVANAGGVIGVWTHLADTPLEYAKNIRAMVDIVGVEHVCIGTDTKLTMPYRSPSDKGFGPPPGEKNNNNKDKPNDKPKKRMGERTNEAWDGQKVGFYYAVVGAMLEVGFNEDEIQKIGGGNYCRIFDTATKI